MSKETDDRSIEECSKILPAAKMAYEHYGPARQLIKTGEEAAEFGAKAVKVGMLTLDYGEPDEKSLADLAEEYFDLTQMLLPQFELAMKHNAKFWEHVEQIGRHKQLRTIQRINKARNNER